VSSEGTCDVCGLSVWHENHEAFHKIHIWNQDVKRLAVEREMAKFEKRLPKPEPRKGSGSSTLI